LKAIYTLRANTPVMETIFKIDEDEDLDEEDTEEEEEEEEDE
jgi:hypothetical protein